MLLYHLSGDKQHTQEKGMQKEIEDKAGPAMMYG